LQVRFMGSVEYFGTIVGGSKYGQSCGFGRCRPIVSSPKF